MSGNLTSAAPTVDSGGDRQDWVEFVRFRLGDEYALELGRVERILRDPSVSPVPGTDDAIAGVTNLGSQIPVVVDGRGVLGLPDRSPDAESDLLLLDREEARPSGLLVDDVVGIEAHNVEVLRAPADCGDWEPSIGRRWFRAVVAESDGPSEDGGDGSETRDAPGRGAPDRLTGVFDLGALLAEARGQA